MKNIFTPVLFAAAMAAMSTFTAGPANAQDINYNDTRESVEVSGEGAYFLNGHGNTDGIATVGTATVSNDAQFVNGNEYGNGKVTIANVINDGQFINGYYGGIGTADTANVNSGGVFYNGGGYAVGNAGTATVSNGGKFYNGYDNSVGKVTTADVSGGEFYNGYSFGTGEVITANVSGGEFWNGDYFSTGGVKTANVSGGKFYNGFSGYGAGAGTVENLFFSGGEYYVNDKSTIKNLVLNTQITEAEQAEQFNVSAVQTLSFGENYGLVTITAQADDTYSNTINVSALTIDLDGIDLLLDLQNVYSSLADLTPGIDFSLSDLFAAYEGVVGGDALGSFGLSFGADELVLFTAGDWESGWSYANGVITYDGEAGDGTTPEPATLLMFGIGLAGLAVSRLRRRK